MEVARGEHISICVIEKDAEWKSIVTGLVYIIYVIVYSELIDSVPKWSERSAALRRRRIACARER